MIYYIKQFLFIKVIHGARIYAFESTSFKDYEQITLFFKETGLLSGNRGLFYPKNGNYIKWTFNNQNILIE